MTWTRLIMKTPVVEKNERIHVSMKISLQSHFLGQAVPYLWSYFLMKTFRGELTFSIEGSSFCQDILLLRRFPMLEQFLENTFNCQAFFTLREVVQTINCLGRFILSPWGSCRLLANFSLTIYSCCTMSLLSCSIVTTIFFPLTAFICEDILGRCWLNISLLGESFVLRLRLYGNILRGYSIR